MKNLVKIAAVAVLSLGFGVAAQAQTNGEASMTATASVLGNLEVTAPTELSFGQVMPGFDKYVPMTGGEATSNSLGTVNQTGVESGLFKVFAAQGASIQLDLAITPFANGTNILPIDFNKGLAEDGTETTLAWGNDGISPVKMIIGENVISSFPSSLLDDKNGVNVYVGGTVRPAANQASGAYAATITLTASYN